MDCKNKNKTGIFRRTQVKECNPICLQMGSFHRNESEEEVTGGVKYEVYKTFECDEAQEGRSCINYSVQV
jgi:hypothetical protein